jgi:hypothetical protein
MKPPPPPKPTEKLPITHHLTIVPGTDPRTHSVVATKMQGDEVRRRVVVKTYDSAQDAIDEFCRLSYRLFYFRAPEEIFGEEG